MNLGLNLSRLITAPDVGAIDTRLALSVEAQAQFNGTLSTATLVASQDTYINEAASASNSGTATNLVRWRSSG